MCMSITLVRASARYDPPTRSRRVRARLGAARRQGSQLAVAATARYRRVKNYVIEKAVCCGGRDVVLEDDDEDDEDDEDLWTAAHVELVMATPHAIPGTTPATSFVDVTNFGSATRWSSPPFSPPSSLEAANADDKAFHGDSKAANANNTDVIANVGPTDHVSDGEPPVSALVRDVAVADGAETDLGSADDGAPEANCDDSVLGELGHLGQQQQPVKQEQLQQAPPQEEAEASGAADHDHHGRGSHDGDDEEEKGDDSAVEEDKDIHRTSEAQADHDAGAAIKAQAQALFAYLATVDSEIEWVAECECDIICTCGADSDDQTTTSPRVPSTSPSQDSDSQRKCECDIICTCGINSVPAIDCDCAIACGLEFDDSADVPSVGEAKAQVESLQIGSATEEPASSSPSHNKVDETRPACPVAAACESVSVSVSVLAPEPPVSRIPPPKIFPKSTGSDIHGVVGTGTTTTRWGLDLPWPLSTSGSSVERASDTSNGSSGGEEGSDSGSDDDDDAKDGVDRGLTLTSPTSTASTSFSSSRRSSNSSSSSGNDAWSNLRSRLAAVQPRINSHHRTSTGDLASGSSSGGGSTSISTTTSRSRLRRPTDISAWRALRATNQSLRQRLHSVEPRVYAYEQDPRFVTSRAAKVSLRLERARQSSSSAFSAPRWR